MRKLIALVAASAALFVAGLANAAPVNIILSQTAPAATTWNLAISWTDPIAVAAVTVNIQSSPVGTFATGANTSPCTTCTPTSGFSLVVADSATNLRLALVPPGDTFTTGPQTNYLLGTWTGAGVPVLLEGNPLDAGTVQDADFNSIPFTLSVVPNVPVPEPAALVLLGLGLSGIALARRKAA